MAKNNYIHRTGQFTSFDGVKIGYYKEGNKNGLPVVLSNGLGGTFVAWKFLINELKDRCLFLSWDYRGLYKSSQKVDKETLSVEYQTRDLEHFLKKEKIKKAVFIGWSMGVQVNFELYKTHPEWFAGIIVLNGTYGSPFRTAMGADKDGLLLRTLTGIAKRLPRVATFTVKSVTSIPNFLFVFKKLGLVAPTLSDEILWDIIKDFKNLDFSIYFETLQRLGDHDAQSVLDKIKCPTLIIAGGKDILTPVNVAKTINKKVKKSKLIVIPDATHYALAEYPDVVIKEVKEFIRKLKN
jgi:pimeloyl-ACP methyl ester carboxylesterase